MSVLSNVLQDSMKMERFVVVVMKVVEIVRLNLSVLTVFYQIY
jgi:hypothetical protein